MHLLIAVTCCGLLSRGSHVIPVLGTYLTGLTLLSPSRSIILNIQSYIYSPVHTSREEGLLPVELFKAGYAHRVPYPQKRSAAIQHWTGANKAPPLWPDAEGQEYTLGYTYCGDLLKLRKDIEKPQSVVTATMRIKYTATLYV